jgi:hypothetical protein
MNFSYKLFKALLVSTILIVGIVSCKKELDLMPTDQIIGETAFKSVDDLQKGLFSVYSSFGAGLSNGIYIGSILADEVKLSNENRGQGQFSFKWQYTGGGGEHNADYATFYRAIDRIHRVLAAIPNVPAANAAEETQKKLIQAELTAFRGMAYFELLKRFMPPGYDAGALGVPVVLESNLFQKPTRNTVGEVMSQIQADLSAARSAPELPNSVADGLRLSKAAVAGYQARAALLRRDWNEAITLASEAITLSGTTLATRTQYRQIWSDSTNTEVIFRMRNNYNIQLLWRDSNGDVFFEPSDKLKAQYDRTNDIRFPTFFGRVVTTGSGAQNDTSIVIKYPGSAAGPQRNDIKVIRVSEMYLIRAEAYAETNQLQKAADEINAIRSNRITGHTPATFTSKDQAITAILNERFRELAFEGFRFFDLKRRGLGVERLASDVQSASWQTLAAGNFRFALPIPQSEIFANPNTVQNPGYD